MMISEMECKNNILGVNWALMNSCNYKYNYCHSGLNSDSIKAPPDEFTVKLIGKTLKYSNRLQLKPYFEFAGDGNSSGYSASPGAVNQQAGQGRGVLCSSATATGVSLGGVMCNA